MKHTLLFVFCFSAIFSSGQTLQGLYKNDKGEQVIFQHDNKIEFSLLEYSCLGPYTIIGMGNFTLTHNRLKIQTVTYSKSTGSAFQLVSQEPLLNETKIRVYVSDFFTKKPIGFVNVICRYDRKPVIGSVTDSAGFASLTIPPFAYDVEITINSIGYIPLKIPVSYNTDSEYSVLLRDGMAHVIENQKIVYAFYQNNDTLFLRRNEKWRQVHSAELHKLIKQ